MTDDFTIQADDFFLNAMIIDNTNGEIMNAKQVSASKSSVESIWAYEAGIVAEEYYDLNGVRVEEPVHGIFIKRTVFGKGSKQYSKVLIGK